MWLLNTPSSGKPVGNSPSSSTAVKTGAPPPGASPPTASSERNVPVTRDDRKPAPEEVTPVSSVEARAQVRLALDEWLAATNARDINRQMSFYPAVTERYYQKQFAPQNIVRQDKLRVFGDANSVEMRVIDPVINISPDESTAIMKFRKQFRIVSGSGTQQGEVEQEMQWMKKDDGWKITHERDLKRIR